MSGIRPITYNPRGIKHNGLRGGSLRLAGGSLRLAGGSLLQKRLDLLQEAKADLYGGYTPKVKDRSANDVVTILPVEPVKPIVVEDPDSVKAHLKKTSSNWLKRGFDKTASIIGDTIIPRVVDKLVGKIINKIEGKEDEPDKKEAIVKGGSLAVSRALKAHGLRADNQRIRAAFRGHRRGGKNQTMVVIRRAIA